MGSALMGSLQVSCFLTEGLFGYSYLPTLSSQKCQGVPFSAICKINYCCSGPIGVDLICPQPNATTEARPGALVAHRHAGGGAPPRAGGLQRRRPTLVSVSVNKNTPFTRALASQASSSNRNPAPDSVFSKLIFQPVFLSGGVFSSQTP